MLVIGKPCPFAIKNAAGGRVINGASEFKTELTDLSRAREQAEQTVVVADAELARSKRAAEQTIVTAEAESRQRMLTGKGEGTRQLQVGLCAAAVESLGQMSVVESGKSPASARISAGGDGN